MLDLYINAKNSLDGLNSALRIAISNANNFNTPGFKYTFASFTTVYSEALSSGTATQNPLQLGTSMTLGATRVDFSQGNISIGSPLDVAILGEGFFILSASDSDFSSGAPKLYSRAGSFIVDSSNTFLTDSFGRKVYGFKVDENGNPTSNELVPIETDGESDIGFIEGGILAANWNASKTDVNIDPKPLYRLALTSFQNKQGLVLKNGGAFQQTVASGDSFAPGAANSRIGSSGNSYGDLQAEAIETTNVDVARVALDMNLLNRGFSAVTGVIDDITKILSNLISKLPG